MPVSWGAFVSTDAQGDWWGGAGWWDGGSRGGASLFGDSAAGHDAVLAYFAASNSAYYVGGF